MATTNVNLNLDLDSLSDVDLTGQAVGFILTYDGTNWVPTDTVFLDEANDRVGIGTTTPSEKLEVEGNSIFNGWVSIGGSRAYSSIFTLRAGSSDNALALISTDLNCNLLMEDSSTTQVTTLTRQGNDLYILRSGGNVGIGSPSADEKLHVHGKIKATDINFTGLPTSATGLSAGDVWNDGGTLKIV